LEHQIRNIAGEELEEFRRSIAQAFGNEYNNEHLELGREIFEFDRNLAAIVDGRIAGTAGISSTEMSVPGGSLPLAAVTMVSVKPTHRRRGIVSGLMRQQLEQIRERGEAIAALWASESSIYGRFGYGIAIQMEMLEVPRVHAALRSDLAAGDGTIRLLTLDEAKELLPPLHESLRRERPGELARKPGWWKVRIFEDLKDWRDGFTANNFVVYQGPKGPEGYARYRTKSHFEDWLPDGRLRIEEMYAATPDALVGIWRYLFGVDLIGTLEREVGEMDEPLLAMLVDSRRVKRRRTDAIWLRIVDVEKALSGRALATEGRVVFEVVDRFLDGGSGRFELEGGPGGAVCRRTSNEPEFVVGPEELGQVYLGGGRLNTLYRVGRVRGDPGAIARADAMLGWSILPRCQEHF
jgi:predicted acetyltransferase